MQTKEAIATRMFRNAARQWGYGDTNMDNFDPLVRLLIEACAVEIYRLGNQFQSVEERMVEKLATILTPQVYVKPKPAHAVMQGRASYPEFVLSRGMQFYCNKKIVTKANAPQSSIDLFFSPTGAYKVTDSAVKIIASGNTVYNISETGDKEILLKMKGSTVISPNEMWLGLELKNVTDLTNVSLFFNLKNTPDLPKYYSLIPYVQCSINGTPLHLRKGVMDLTIEDGNLPFENSLEELYINNRVEHYAEAFYANQFVTLTEDNKFLKNITPDIRATIPAELEHVLNASELRGISNQMVWMKISFRPEFTTEVLDDLTVALNCFPVINRKQNEITYRLQSYFNIIPLLTQDEFLSVNKVDSTAESAPGDKEYKYYSFDQFDKAQKGTYTIRAGHMERFDSRNALEYLEYIVELLRDESRTFAALGQDFVASTIKDLNQNISQIEQKIRQNSSVLSNTPAYLLINPIAENDTVFVKYWTCAGDQGNQVRYGTRLDLYEGSDVKKDSLVFMTGTTGGADKLDSSEALAAYKHVLISRGRLVTQQDIKTFCHYFLRNKVNVNAISISKGVGVSTKPTEGLIQTVDIKITPAKNDQMSPEEWAALKHELLVNLEEQSAVNLNYRVFVN